MRSMNIMETLPFAPNCYMYYCATDKQISRATIYCTGCNGFTDAQLCNSFESSSVFPENMKPIRIVTRGKGHQKGDGEATSEIEAPKLIILAYNRTCKQQHYGFSVEKPLNQEPSIYQPLEVT